MQIRKTAFFLLAILFVGLSAHAQQANPFQESKIRKVSHDERAAFQKKYDSIKWTGQGLYEGTIIDNVPTVELRARLQARFGDPTQKLEDLIDTEGFRPAEAIEFEYWFVVNDSIPMMVLDVDGPFDEGLVYGGASRYIDLMPQIKRTFSRQLMAVDKLAPFQDYFYSPEREQWFDVQYKNGKFKKEKIPSPKGMTINFDY